MDATTDCYLQIILNIGSLRTNGSSHLSNNGSYGVLSFHVDEKEPHHQTGYWSKWKVAIIAAVLSSPKL
jgi:hypothetical protein